MHIDDRDKWYPEVNSGGQVVGRFRFNETLPDIAASLAADREIKRKIIVLESKAIASSDVSVQPVKPYNEREFRTRFPEAWAAFQGEEVKIVGTPVKQMGVFTEDQVLFLQLNGVLSVEQLAGLDDAKCNNLGFGWRTSRQKARDFLAKYVDAAKQEDLRTFIEGEVEKRMGAPAQPVAAIDPPAAQVGAAAGDLLAENEALKARIAALEAAATAAPTPVDPMAKARAAKAAKRASAETPPDPIAGAA